MTDTGLENLQEVRRMQLNIQWESVTKQWDALDKQQEDTQMELKDPLTMNEAPPLRTKTTCRICKKPILCHYDLDGSRVGTDNEWYCLKHWKKQIDGEYSTPHDWERVALNHDELRPRIIPFESLHGHK